MLFSEELGIPFFTGSAAKSVSVAGTRKVALVFVHIFGFITQLT